MSIIITATYDDAIDRARAQSRYDQLGGYHGIKALFDHYEELSEGDDTELDVIAWCCEWSTYENLDDFFDDYSGYADDIKDLDASERYEFLQDLTWVVPFNGGVHVYQF